MKTAEDHEKMVHIVQYSASKKGTARTYEIWSCHYDSQAATEACTLLKRHGFHTKVVSSKVI